MGCAGGYGKISASDTVNTVYPYNWTPYTGIYYMSSKTRITDIGDGSSNTMAFGEYTGEHNGTYSASGYPSGSREFVFSWMGGGFLTTRWGLAPVYGPSPDPTFGHGWTGGGTDYTWRMFSSRHTGIVNFAWADGSVRPVSKSCDYNTFVYASGINDGKVYDLGALGQ
jgi:prepilin-type processing-associated H-X9-DG protein